MPDKKILFKNFKSIYLLLETLLNAKYSALKMLLCLFLDENYLPFCCFDSCQTNIELTQTVPRSHECYLVDEAKSEDDSFSQSENRVYQSAAAPINATRISLIRLVK